MSEPQSNLDGVYKDIILEHNQEPRNFGELPDASVRREGYNPLCGDKICLALKIDQEGRIKHCRFEGQGCSICIASSSIMTEEVTGATVAETKEKIADFRALMQGTRSPDEFGGDMEALAGVRKFPVRIKCALLGWTTLQGALEEKKTEEKKPPESTDGA